MSSIPTEERVNVCGMDVGSVSSGRITTVVTVPPTIVGGEPGVEFCRVLLCPLDKA